MAVVYTEIYKIVQSIPKGRVLTYGLISYIIGGRMSAQGVGWALKALGSANNGTPLIKKSGAKRVHGIAVKERGSEEKSTSYNLSTVPWQRVVNGQGGTSTHKVAGIPPGLQQHILETEGIVFDSEGKLDLKRYLWLEGVGHEHHM